MLLYSQRPAGPSVGSMVLLHGLEGSAESGYMRSLSQAGLEAGYTMHRLHMRSCGGTVKHAPTLYHAGLTSDVLAVLRFLAGEEHVPLHLAGFSLGGNVALKLAGELGEHAGELLTTVCAVSTPIDLEASARRIGQPDNRLYERRFLKRMLARAREFGLPETQLRGIGSIYAIDDRVIAPMFGFRGARHYYATQSASKYLDRIRIPTLCIQARDDTFIPFEIFRHPAFERNPHLTLWVTEHGGHLGYLSRRRPRFWLDRQLLSWIGSRQPVSGEVSSTDSGSPIFSPHFLR